MFKTYGDTELKAEVFATTKYGSNIQGITVCPDGNIYIGPNHVVVKFSVDGVEELYAGIPGSKGFTAGHRLSQATFETIGGLRFIKGALYLCDRGANVVARIKHDQVIAWAGDGTKGCKDGPKEQARFSYPTDIIFFQGKYFVSDYDNNNIRVIENGIVSSISAGDRPFALVGYEESLFVSCHMSNTIREVLWKENRTDLIAGGLSAHTNGEIEKATFHRTRGLVVHNQDRSLYVADCLNHTIRKLSIEPPKNFQKSENVEPSHDLRKATIPYQYVSDFLGAGSDIVTIPTTLEIKYPYFMTTTPDGDLLWTGEYSKDIYIVRNFDLSLSALKIPCIRMRNGLFLPFCESEYLPHVKLLHQASQRTFIIHPALLQYSLSSFTEKSLQLLETSELPDIALERFLAYASGSNSEVIGLNFVEQSIYWAQIIALLNRIEIRPKEAIFDCAVSQFLLILSSLSASELFNVLVIVEIQGNGPIEVVQALLQALLLQAEKEGADIASFSSYLNKAYSVTTEQALAKMMGATALTNPTTNDCCFPYENFQTELENIAKNLRITNLDPETLLSQLALAQPTSKSPNVIVGIPGSSHRILVHDWILYNRWGYFKRAVDSGIWKLESVNFDLPDDFPPTLLLPLMQWIYSNGTFMSAIESEYDVMFLLLRGGEFDFVDLERNPKPGFGRLIEHCHRRLSIPSTITNCLPSLQYAMDTGQEDKAVRVTSFIKNNLPAVKSCTTPEQLKILCSAITDMLA